jgi:hypothetical protein
MHTTSAAKTAALVRCQGECTSGWAGISRESPLSRD